MNKINKNNSEIKGSSNNRIKALLRKFSLKWAGSKIVNLIVYFMLFEFVYIFVYPYLYMLVNSLKYEVDLKDLTKLWMITKPNIGNYTTVFRTIDYWGGLRNNLVICGLSALGQVLSCSFIGYGLARFKFKGRNLLFALVIFGLMVPPQIFNIPLFIQFSKIQWVGTILPIVVPSFFGFGLKGGLFVFIFRQFYKGIPKSYEESARLEGYGEISVFLKVVLPLSKSSILVTVILSIVWHWNDYFEPITYLRSKTQMLSQMLALLNDFRFMYATAAGNAINMVALAGCVLATLPLLIIYLVCQRQFLAGVEHSGLAN